MAIKSFHELYQLELGSRVSKKPVFKYDKAQGKSVKTGQELDYISWPDCLVLLYENGAEKVQYGNITNADGHSLFLSNGALPEVRVFVEVDGDRRELTYPVIDGTKDIPMDKIVQSDVHNATQRAFVKCVAVNWGLGLSLWQKEEKAKPTNPVDDLSIHNIYAIKQRVEQLLTARLQNGLAMPDLLQILGLSKKRFDILMASFNDIAVLERKLREL